MACLSLFVCGSTSIGYRRSRQLKELRADGATVPEIVRGMKLSKASVYRALNG